MSNSSCQASEQHSKSAHKRDVWRQHNDDEITMCIVQTHLQQTLHSLQNN